MKQPIAITRFPPPRVTARFDLKKRIISNVASLNRPKRVEITLKDKPKIIGQIAICKHEMWELAVRELSKHVDEMYIRFDMINGNHNFIPLIEKACNGKLKGLLKASKIWDESNWREDLMRMLDNVKPDLVLSVDEDEVFEDSIDSEILDFYRSNKDGMMFNFFGPMPTEDGSIILGGKPYPLHMHMKAFRWRPGLTYYPYTGNAKITNYVGSDCWYIANTKIKHYSLYKKEWYKSKEEWIKKFWGKDYFNQWYKTGVIK